MSGPLLYDRVKETTTITGTGTISLSGAITKHRSFSVVGNSNSCYYGMVNRSADEWEVGVGTYSASALTRDSVLASSNSNSLVNFSSGTKEVFLPGPASLLGPQLDSVGGRITLTSGTAITTSDVTAAATIYFTPCTHNRIALWNGFAWVHYLFTERSLALSLTTHATPTGNTSSGSATVTSMSSTSGLYAGEPISGNGIASGSVIKSVDSSSQITLSINATATNTGTTFTIQHANYDVYLYDSSGTLTLELANWTNNTTRATALTTQDGVYVKTGATTRRYLGTIRASGTNTTEDSLTKRYVWNSYNRIQRGFSKNDTGNWNYTTNAYRPANNSTSNRVEAVIGLSENPVFIRVECLTFNTGGNNAQIGIGLDSTTVNSAARRNSDTNSGGGGLANANYFGFPGVGYHFFQWLENSIASGTTTFYATGLCDTNSGIEGWILA